jgi:hypothetical protein
MLQKLFECGKFEILTLLLWWNICDVSEKRIASIFMFEEQAQASKGQILHSDYSQVRRCHIVEGITLRV